MALTSATIIIPCHDEAAWVGGCIASVLCSVRASGLGGEVEIVAVANGCTDRTLAVVRSFEPEALRAGVRLVSVALDRRSKALALNHGDALASGGIRIYLDADVTMEPALLGELVRTLGTGDPVFASGRLTVPDPRGLAARAYARAWQNLPLVTDDVPGFGLYAVSAAGRRRWGAFPDLHSDDKFVRLHFARSERRRVAAAYRWPLPDDLPTLIRARSRWCAGNRELAQTRPDLVGPRSSRSTLSDVLRLAADSPSATAVFAAVYLWGEVTARLMTGRASDIWASGRPQARPDAPPADLAEPTP